MKISYQIIRLEKLYPLAISRGISTGSRNLFVLAEQDGHVGIGECAPGTGFDETLADQAQNELVDFVFNNDLKTLSIEEIWSNANAAGVNRTALAALDVALWDLKAKLAGMPLYELFGLSKKQTVTSVTIGINPVDVIRERVPEILQRTGGKALKIKLGSPDGFERDKENFLAAKEASAPFGARLRVDANGGWDVPTAISMMQWIADRGCEYVEQPLARGEEAGLPELYKTRPLPIFADESCHLAEDVPKLANCVDGINLKLMKCGGLTEALKIVHVAHAHGLQTMIGCMGESSVAISAGAAIGACFDHIDLDSQLNLINDPADGALLVDGCLVPPDRPGHGAILRD